MKIFKGTVEPGSKRAGLLGYPTLNIQLEDSSTTGIYAGIVHAEGLKYASAIFADPKRKILEAHVLDFSGDLYGKEIAMELFEKIRENEMFADDALLQKAIANDVARVRAYFLKKESTS